MFCGYLKNCSLKDSLGDPKWFPFEGNLTLCHGIDPMETLPCEPVSEVRVSTHQSDWLKGADCQHCSNPIQHASSNPKSPDSFGPQSLRASPPRGSLVTPLHCVPDFLQGSQGGVYTYPSTLGVFYSETVGKKKTLQQCGIFCPVFLSGS